MDPHSDDVWHVVVLWRTNRTEKVDVWVDGAHLHPGGAVRPDTELHKALLVFHHTA